jgi:ribosomal protein L11 methyltransferase
LKKIEQVNWNEEWEKNFEAIDVDGKCHVRAPFHEKTNAEFDIVIEPKMSFGTGHHETTHMMIQHILETDLTNKKTLDMGCGTAILAILAEMKGAKPIDAIDIDNWCYLNSIENAERNNCEHISVYEGDADFARLEKNTMSLLLISIEIFY